MVFYFSGTGNSLWVAKNIANSLSDKLIPIGDYIKDRSLQPIFTLNEDEKVGFVFPVHSWGIPPVMSDFIKRLQITGYHKQLIFGIFTCGDECGDTKKMFLKLLSEKGFECHHVYSIQMPNNYIALPGFDVDAEDIAQEKKQRAKQILPTIISAITNDKITDSYTKGKFTFLKSGLIYPLFRKYATDDRPFYSKESCTSCGLCVKKCPVGNLSLENGHPVWGKRCTQCMACIHNCPTRSIEYGKATLKKGRYVFKEE